MKRSYIILLVVAGIAAAFAIVYFFGGGRSSLQYQWTESYRGDNDQPYGTAFLRRMMEAEATEGFTYNKSKSIASLLNDSVKFENSSYVLIGQDIHLDDEDVDALLEFMDNGNDVFISTLTPPADLIAQLDDGCESFYYNSNPALTMRMNFFKDSLGRADGYEYTYRYGRQDFTYYWHLFRDTQFCTGPVVPLGYQEEGEVNFVKVPHGSGNLFIHATPLVFTNYFLKDEDKFEYASIVFSHLENRNRILWDEYSKIPFARNENSFDSPLHYIMQQPSLKYAWWLLLITVALYVFVAAKRAQRPIPVLEIKSNTSLEFVRMISSLHYVNGNHQDIARKKMKYFLYFVRSRYAINESTFTSDTITKLSDKSGVARGEIADIINQYYAIESMRYNILPDTLMFFYDAVEKFYKNCK